MVICPLCQKIYQPNGAQILELAKPTSLVHSNCPQCGYANLALVIDFLIGQSSVNMTTELTFHDLLKFEKQEEITIDEMIEIHQELNSLKSMQIFLKTSHNKLHS